jgi:hypothetical protein
MREKKRTKKKQKTHPFSVPPKSLFSTGPRQVHPDGKKHPHARHVRPDRRSGSDVLQGRGEPAEEVEVSFLREFLFFAFP